MSLHINNNKLHCNEILPPLPERAITGLTRGLKIDSDGSLFHTVHLWEFTNLHAILIDKTWSIISDFLKQANLTKISQEIQVNQRVLEEICRYNTYATHISNLCKIGQMAGLNPDAIETSVKAVRFSRNGSLEYISFPFNIDIYAWRLLCHIPGDGSVKYHKTTCALPEVKWNQLPENQKFMIELLKRWDPKVLNSDLDIKYPKALTYAIIGSIPGLTFRDLRSSKFVQLVLDLPQSYRDWKLQFLTAFLVDDGSVGKMVAFNQMNKKKLEYVMKLCDQLGYKHSPYPPKQKSNGIYSFRLRASGVLRFFFDIQKLTLKDPLLGLWHKHHKLETRVLTYSAERVQHLEISERTYINILVILGDHKPRTNRDLQCHPKLRSLTIGKSRK